MFQCRTFPTEQYTLCVGRVLCDMYPIHIQYYIVGLPFLVFAVLKMRKAELNMSLVETHELTIHRENIVDEVLNAYRRHSNIVHCLLKVKFVGEEVAEDLEGVTREMFTVFMRDFSLEEHSRKLPAMDHQVLDGDTFQILGRIVSHAFVLVVFWNGLLINTLRASPCEKRNPPTVTASPAT